MAQSSEEKNNELNIAGRITSLLIDNKLTILIIIFALLTGLLSFLITPREENPQIVVPAANIIVAKPGATPKEVEQLIVKPLEAILQGLQGVEHTYGIAMDSLGIVSVQFHVGEDKEESLVKLYDRLASNLDAMPPGTQQPLIKPVDVDNVPILTISLSTNSRDDLQLRRIANDVLEHLRQVKDVSVSFIHGGRIRQINVELDLTRMKRFNITLLDIRKALEATNIDIPSGTLVNRNRVTTVTAGGALGDANDVSLLVVGLHNHRPVYLKNVATVRDGPGEIKRVHRIGFGQAYQGVRPDDFEVTAVSIAIAKVAGANAVTVAENILAKLDAIKASVIPEDVTVNVTRNDGARAQDAVNVLMEHLAIAIITIIILLVIFLGWRAAGIVTLTIPLILFIVLTVGFIFGHSINRITLFALILSLGLLVDDSIVVVENIFRHYSRKGIDKLNATVQAVNEIGKPTNLATFTVILAFLPMAWVTGMMGPYMGPIPFYVPVAMITSLMIAYTVAPWAAYRWLKIKGHEHEGLEHAEHNGRLEQWYVRIMQRLLGSRATRYSFLGALLVTMMLVLTMPSLGLVLFKMLPKNNNNTFNVTINMPEGTALEETDRITRRVGDILRQHPQVETYETTVGETGVVDFNGLLRGSNLNRGPHIAEVRANLRDKHDRELSSIDIVLQLRESIAKLASETGANIKLVEDPPGPPVRATILAELYGPDYEQLRSIAKDLRREVFATTEDIVDIDDTVGHDSQEYQIVVNREKAALSGIAPAQVAETLRTFLSGHSIGAVQMELEKEPVPIHLRIPVADRVTSSDLDKIFFTSPQGKQVALTAIAEIKARPAAKAILHKDQRPVVYVTGELASTSQVYAVLRMKQYLDEHPLPGNIKLKQYFMADPDTLGYSVRWDGEMRLTLDVFRDMGSAFIVAIILIYLVLVGYYGSFMVPIIVMGAIPLTIIGFLPGHAIVGQYFTATSMIGVIALAGVVVRNSLLLIDFIIENQAQGRSLEDAVLLAGQTRLRPIMLTALAIVLGTLVIIIDPVFGGLATSLIFGTFVSTVLTLFVIPLLYFMYESRKA
jgi:multidrug efflux pump subunit AcrB